MANLLLLAALAAGTTPEAVADEIGAGGSAKLKAYVTEAVNEHFRPIRARRAEFAADPSVVRAVLERGNEIARETARTTLARGARADASLMGTRAGACATLGM